MSVNEQDFIFPDVDSVHFTKEEWARAEKKIDEIKDNLRKKVKHIIVADPNKPLKKPYVPKKIIEEELEKIDAELKWLEQWQ